MANLYIITGPAGVGKSTVSKKIAESRVKSVLIEGDEIYHHVIGGYVSPWKEGNHLEIFWKICTDNISTYLENGYDVIFNYIVNEEDLEMIKEKFSCYELKFVVLMVDESILIQRDKQRPRHWQMGERCIVLLNSFKNKAYDSKYILDTSDMTVNETANCILNSTQYIIE